MRSGSTSITVVLSPYRTEIPEVAVGRGSNIPKHCGLIEALRKYAVPVHKVLFPSRL